MQMSKSLRGTKVISYVIRTGKVLEIKGSIPVSASPREVH